MDVHPPHEPVHTWRDALMHLGIVTVGLFYRGPIIATRNYKDIPKTEFVGDGA